MTRNTNRLFLCTMTLIAAIGFTGCGSNEKNQQDEIKANNTKFGAAMRKPSGEASATAPTTSTGPTTTTAQ